MKIKRKTFLLTAKLVIVLMLFVSIQVFAAVYNLDANPALWEKELQDYGDVPPAEACTFEIVNNELNIGPWLAGEYGARYAYKDNFNFTTGTVSGYYKAQNALDGQVQVAIYFKDSNGNIKYKDKFQLSNVTEWTQFSLPIRRAYPNTVKVAVAFGNCIKNNGKVSFKDLQVTDSAWSIQFPAAPPALTRQAPPTTFTPTGKWRLEEANGTWWFVKPNGDAFYSLGLEAPYVDVPTTLEVFNMIEGLSFNTLGGWTDIYQVGPVNDQRSEPFPALVPLESGSLTGFDRVVSAKGEAYNLHTMPDPFDSRYKVALKTKISKIKSRTEGRDWFIGYFADNEVVLTDLHRAVYSTNCAEAFKTWLTARYNNSISSLNAAWGKSYASFTALMTAKPDPIKKSGTMYDDFMAFKRVIVQKYVDESKSAFMEVYNNNPPLIFSNRFTIDLSEVYDVLDIFAAAYDGIAINCYPGGTEVGLPQWMKGAIQKAYTIAQKPIIIGEWSVPALDSGLYNNFNNLDFSYPECVDTQTERARQAAYITAEFYNEPFMVGTHWYKWHDIDDSYRRANRGVYKSDGRTPWPELQASLISIHEQIKAYTGSGTPPDPDPDPDPVAIIAAADSYVRGGTSYKNQNYGTQTIINIKDSASETYDRMAYLKFNLGNNTPNSCSSAVLKLYCRKLPNGSPVTAKAFGVDSDSWTEMGITWANKPALGSQLSSVSVTAIGTVYSFDVTSFVSSQLAGDGVVSICITDNIQCNKEIHFDSREGSVKPVLEITY